MRRVVEAANALRPDVVAITGDLVDGSVRMLERSWRRWPRLQARYGVFFVTGNHEYYSGAAAWVEHLRRLGDPGAAQRAGGDRRRRGASFDLAGIDDWRVGRHGPGARTGPGGGARRARPGPLAGPAGPPAARASRKGPGRAWSSRSPATPTAARSSPSRLATALVYPYVHGLYGVKDGSGSQIFVSRGTGYWGPPMRLGSPPEIAHVVLIPMTASRGGSLHWPIP